MIPTANNLIGQIVVAAMLLVSFALFFWAFWSKVRLIFIGRRQYRFDKLGTRFRNFFSWVFGQTLVVREPLPGLVHAFIFWGFLVVVPANFIYMFVGVFPDFYIPYVTDMGWYALSFDIFVVIVLIAVLAAAFRRIVLRPAGPTGGFGPYFILFLIGGLMFTDLVNEGWLISSGIETELARWMPAGMVAAHIYKVTGVAGNIIGEWVYLISWWSHLVMLLVFMVYIPMSKHLHLILCPFNEFFSDLTSKGRLCDCDILDENKTHFGVTRMDEFPWPHLMDLWTCAECGRCQDYCPAFNTDKPLSPKEFIPGLQTVLWEDRKRLLKSRREYGEDIETLVGRDDALSFDAIWSCTTCGACVEHCPIAIEHIDKIVAIRRSMVLNEGKLPHEVNATMKGIERQGNPWNYPRGERMNWAEGIEVPVFAEKKDAEYLLWVGCMGSYDDRSMKISRATIRLLDKAGVNYAVLGDEENCCADSYRRIGNEDLYKEMARENIEKFREYNLRKMIATCPHCYNTFKNEYPELGYEFDEIVYHGDFLLELVNEGKLVPEKPLPGNYTYHDSCYLGRYNDVYDTPRELLESIPGVQLTEMDQNLNRSFCCGAGGGRMWMEEDLGERINVERVEQALETEPDCLVTGCAFCMNMFADALGEKGVAEKVALKDLAEVLDDAV
ncbi:MAG: 4Fe-4S dicluster domain-containing protein [bacterium]|nr:4Fe-4S dicluster domain-containing protein [bacterium]